MRVQGLLALRVVRRHGPYGEAGGRRGVLGVVGYDLIRDYQTAVRVNKLREEILESGALVRPLPIETRAAAPKPAKGKGGEAAKGKGGAAKKAKF